MKLLKQIIRSNYCGGCNADFYLNGSKVNCNQESILKESKLKELTKEPCFSMVVCNFDPCKTFTCQKYPNAICMYA